MIDLDYDLLVNIDCSLVNKIQITERLVHLRPQREAATIVGYGSDT